MSERLGVPTTVRVARSRPGLRAAVASTALLLLVAILKPWAPVAGLAATSVRASPAPSTATGLGPASPTVGPTPASTTDPVPGPGEMTCQVEDWQIVSLDRLADWTVRTWTPAAAAFATDPLDPAIPTVRLDSPRVLGLGVCAPDLPGSGPADESRIVAIWRLDGRRAVHVTFGPLVADPGRRPRPGITALYRPVSDLAAWSPGHYVVAIADAGTGSDAGVRSGAGAAVAGPYLGLIVPGGQ